MSSTRRKSHPWTPLSSTGFKKQKHGRPPLTQLHPKVNERQRKNSTSSSETEQGEGIIVAIRMRPLNTKEKGRGRAWKVLPVSSSITQVTNNDQLSNELVNRKTTFTYDKTFSEDVSTLEVYEDVAKGIVTSVLSGLNGTVFAYGQTSSGKTFTMQGSGSIQEGIEGTKVREGIAHMAARDIFKTIEEEQDARIFLVRASFLEIYNEEVRDLLSDNKVLHIREDARRGVFVNSQEREASNCSELLDLLFQGGRNRAFASTAMNKCSSRSHTIFRVTIESRKKPAENNKENQDLDGNEAFLLSTLNLVDLAGSESIRHIGANMERRIEGGMINTSLLTLSRVIVALGTNNQTHINFRDSKLTRILQPSLSGNARIALICCATPSKLYLEETRSTLLFASRAKLVQTRAQVNKIRDDRSLAHRLQRELAEARRLSMLEQLKAFQQKWALELKLKESETRFNTVQSSLDDFREQNKVLEEKVIELEKVNATLMAKVNDLEHILNDESQHLNERSNQNRRGAEIEIASCSQKWKGTLVTMEAVTKSLKSAEIKMTDIYQRKIKLQSSKEAFRTKSTNLNALQCILRAHSNSTLLNTEGDESEVELTNLKVSIGRDKICEEHLGGNTNAESTAVTIPDEFSRIRELPAMEEETGDTTKPFQLGRASMDYAADPIHALAGNIVSPSRKGPDQPCANDFFVPIYAMQRRRRQPPQLQQKDASGGTDKFKEHSCFTIPENKSFDDAVTPPVSFTEDITVETLCKGYLMVTNKDLSDSYGESGVYTGSILKSTGLPHGLGAMMYNEDNHTYQGQWHHGHWHGYGKTMFANGNQYEGEYRFDRHHGKGKYVWKDGCTYDGMFIDDRRHGQGTFTWPDGAIYEGDYLNGKREGYGSYTFSDGSCYRGQWKNGNRHGQGTYIWPDSSTYKGQFRDGVIEGFGLHKLMDDSWSDGHYKDEQIY